MGLAVVSGVIASQNSTPFRTRLEKWESHTPGTTTPNGILEDETIPTKFLACVSREETGNRLNAAFSQLSGVVQVFAGQNLAAVKEADVVLLWYVRSPRLR
jgi:pyrroline-5-carboxylate reductase